MTTPVNDRRRSRLAGLTLAGLALVVVACQAAGLPRPSLPPAAAGGPAVSASAQPPAQAAQPPAPAQAGQPSGDFATAVRTVAQRARPAVVQITSERIQLDRFDQPFAVPAGVGSGVIYDEQGHILTNHHVVDGAHELLVSLPDGRSFPGQLVGSDPRTDLAVVQINGDQLPVAELGDSRQLQVGDWVVAIGNALGLRGGPTVTAGVVSALDRTVQEPGDRTGSGAYLFDVIQTSAPINPGNSGGPLLNLAGQVVGLNTLVAGQAEPGVQAQGIGFAVALATARPIADQLTAGGRVVHTWLGVSTVPLNPALAAQVHSSAPGGLVVLAVAPGSPAASAGLRPRDVLTALDGTTLEEASDLARTIDAHHPGDTVRLKGERGGSRLELQAELAPLPAS